MAKGRTRPSPTDPEERLRFYARRLGNKKAATKHRENVSKKLGEFEILQKLFEKQTAQIELKDKLLADNHDEIHRLRSLLYMGNCNCSVSAKSSRRLFNHQPDDQHILSQRVMNHNSHRPQHQYSSSSSDSGNSYFDSVSLKSKCNQNPANCTRSNSVSSSIPAIPLPSTDNYSQYAHQTLYQNPQSSVMNPFNSHADQRNYQHSSGGYTQNPAVYTGSMASNTVGSSSSIPVSSTVSACYYSQHPQTAICQTFQSSAQFTENQSTPQTMPADIPSTMHCRGKTSVPVPISSSEQLQQSSQNEEDCEPLGNWMDTCLPRPKKKKSATNLVQGPVNESPCTAFLRAQCLLMGNDLPELRDDV